MWSLEHIARLNEREAEKIQKGYVKKDEDLPYIQKKNDELYITDDDFLGGHNLD